MLEEARAALGDDSVFWIVSPHAEAEVLFSRRSGQGKKPPDFLAQSMEYVYFPAKNDARALVAGPVSIFASQAEEVKRAEARRVPSQGVESSTRPAAKMRR